MADLRFKICGDNPPFIIDVEQNGSSVCKTILSYSAATTGLKDACYTCAIISGLSPDTEYNISISDSVGEQNISSYTTPAAVVPPPPDVKEINLGGTVNTISQTSQTLSGTKNLIITPTLEAGESFDVELCLETVANGVFASTSSDAIISKSTDGGNSFTPVLSVSDGEDDSIWISVDPNVVICYDLLSQVSTAGTNNSSASIEITNTNNVVGIDTLNIGSTNILEVSRSYTVATTTTTTTTTTASPVSTDVNLGIVSATIIDPTTGDTNTNTRIQGSAFTRFWFATDDFYDNGGTGAGNPLDSSISVSMNITTSTFSIADLTTRIMGFDGVSGISVDVGDVSGFRALNFTILAGERQGYIDIDIGNNAGVGNYSVDFLINGSNFIPQQTLGAAGTTFGWSSTSATALTGLIGHSL